jgi:hypothetical protein
MLKIKVDNNGLVALSVFLETISGELAEKVHAEPFGLQKFQLKADQYVIEDFTTKVEIGQARLKRKKPGATLSLSLSPLFALTIIKYRGLFEQCNPTDLYVVHSLEIYSRTAYKIFQ